MKHVVTGAPFCQRLVVTGFGAFPGAPRNPTLEILERLERRRERLRRLGIELFCLQLPVVYAEVETSLADLVAACQPDAVLHLGLASRRPRLCVETRAVNRAGPLHPDAAGQVPPRQNLAPGAPMILPARIDPAMVLTAVRRTGLPAGYSIDAGDYVCNATLFHALRAGIAAQIGFLHVPRPRRATQPLARGAQVRPTIDALTEAVFAAALVMMRRARALQEDGGPTAPPTDGGPENRPRRRRAPADGPPAA